MEDAIAAAGPDTLTLTVDIVAAYVSNNNVTVADLPALVTSVHGALAALLKGPVAAPAAPQKPFVSVAKSITPDYLVCLDDGMKMKSLKRHLTALGMTPEQYRDKWNLPKDYPMVAPNYSARRSALAKSIGLGQVGGRTAADAPKAASETPAAAEPPKSEPAKPEGKGAGKAAKATRDKSTEATAPVREAARTAKGDATRREPRSRKAA